MSGALALILGEFKNDFSREQLLAVCQASCFKLHNTKEWKEQVIYGVLDIRTALLTLHVLKKIKTLLPLKTFEKQFSLTLTTIHTELFALPIAYGKEKGITHSFKESFIDYYNAVHTRTLSDKAQEQLALPLDKAIETIAAKVHKKISFPSAQ